MRGCSEAQSSHLVPALDEGASEIEQAELAAAVRAGTAAGEKDFHAAENGLKGLDPFRRAGLRCPVAERGGARPRPSARSATVDRRKRCMRLGERGGVAGGKDAGR